MNLKFWKMNGAGNDFVCLDNLSGRVRLTRRQRARLCHRQFGVGADGLLVLEPPPQKSKAPARSKAGGSNAQPDFTMRYYNADGGEAEMCGNGARCFARYAQKITGTRKTSISFITPAGLIRADFVKEQVQVDLTPLRDARLHIDIKSSVGPLRVHYADTGVPHVVLPVEDAEAVDVRGLGRELRHHREFAPRGTNVNFMQRLASGLVVVRTYERGVEDETLACGTGVAACAWVAQCLYGLRSPVRVIVRSGARLRVSFTGKSTDAGHLRLLGPADFIYQGEINV